MRNLLLLLATFVLPGFASAAARDYSFDLVHTQILLSVNHLGFSHPSGRLHVKSGSLHFDDDDWSQAKLDVLIDAASIDLGDAVWNDKVRSREFLASDHYPTAHFVSIRVEKTGDKKGIVHGKLTLLGVTHPLDLAVEFNRAGVDAYSLKWTAGFSATASLKRSDFGMSKYLPDVGDQVELRIEVEALRDKNAQEPAQPGDNQPDEKQQ